MKNSSYWITGLDLKRHPEGGYYTESYRAIPEINTKDIFQEDLGNRNLATSIYYLLENSDVSVFHRLRSDELWYYHYGSPMLLHTFDSQNQYKQFIVGPELNENQQLQVLIPAGYIFGAEVLYSEEYSLIGCVVTPGFHYNDFEIIPRDYLMKTFPNHKELIEKLS